MTTQSREQLTSQVIDIIFQSLNLRHIEKSTVNESTPLVGAGLNLDSIDILEMVVNMEQKFNFKLKANEAGRETFQSIGTVVNLVQSYQTQSGSHP